MTARTSMTALIAKARRLIADTSGSPVFTDNDIQDALDVRRLEQRFVALQPSPSFTTGGATLFLDYYADYEYWEDDVLLQDMSYNTLTASLAEPLVGHWHFTSAPNGFGVRATGKTYDMYGACADLLDSWAATVMLQFDATTGRDTFNRSQKFDMIAKLAATYRSRALAQQTRATQREIPSDISTNAVTYPAYGDETSG